jgi:hypothetical protein
MVLRTDLVRRLTARAQGSGAEGDASLAELPEGRSRREMLQRLQFGIGGVATMFLLVSLASIIDRRADMADAATVPEAVTASQSVSDALDDDPLVSAGVVPDLPPEAVPATSSPASTGARQGNGATPPP